MPSRPPQRPPEEFNHSTYGRAKTIDLLKQAIAATNATGPGVWELDESSCYLALEYIVESEAKIRELGEDDPFERWGGTLILLAAGIALQDVRGIALGEGDKTISSFTADILTAPEA